MKNKKNKQSIGSRNTLRLYRASEISLIPNIEKINVDERSDTVCHDFKGSFKHGRETVNGGQKSYIQTRNCHKD